MRYHSYLQTAIRIIGSYQGEIPLAVFLKQFFARDKKYGSGDRKQIASLCYNYYRIGKALDGQPLEEKILTGFFLCEQEPGEMMKCLRPEWNDAISLTLQEKFEQLKFPLQEVFPWAAELGADIDPIAYTSSFFHQPRLYLRIRPGKREKLFQALNNAALPFEAIAEDTLALPNGTKLDGIIDPDRDMVIQDLNSQHVLDILKNPDRSIVPDLQSGLQEGKPISVWDCCAASGGKSILAWDILKGQIQLTVSDIRRSSLANLEKRFSMAGIRGYRSAVMDLEKVPATDPAVAYQLIICDAPCTGSGTWSRTPEQLCFFKTAAIGEYAKRQERILSNAIPHLQEGGLLIYITCSVFHSENEAITDLLQKEFRLQLIQAEYLKGYASEADTLYTAVFKK